MLTSGVVMRALRAPIRRRRVCFSRGLAWAPTHMALPRRTAAELYAEIRKLTSPGGDYTVHNYMAVIEDFRPEAVMVETDLFPRGAIEYYTAKNMGRSVSDEDTARWWMQERGGDQGDYRDGMPRKIANAIDCLRSYPHSKRAIIPIPFNSYGSENVDWTDAGQTKCCRELHLYIEEGKLSATGFLRMQNASIFPKNIHFFATLLEEVGSGIGCEVGSYTHIISSLCHDRTATQC